MTTRKGRCLCGAVAYEYDGPENWVGHCHCESCRRNCSAPFTTFVGVPRAAVRMTGVTPDVYPSSPGVRRHFCPRCGSSVFSRSGDEIEVNLGALDAPNQLTPTYELWTVRREAWLPAFPLRKHYEHDRDTASRFED
jgi:hypothetical protein